MKILIIDDDHRVRFAIMKTLGEHGHEVLTAANGERGVILFLRDRPDLVIMEIVITPEADGIDTIAHMRREGAQTRIIGMSETARSGLIDPAQAAQMLGVDDLIGKPIDAEELLGALHGRRSAATV